MKIKSFGALLLVMVLALIMVPPFDTAPELESKSSVETVFGLSMSMDVEMIRTESTIQSFSYSGFLGDGILFSLNLTESLDTTLPNNLYYLEDNTGSYYNHVYSKELTWHLPGNLRQLFFS